MTNKVPARNETDKVPKYAFQLRLFWFPLGAIVNTFSMTVLLITLGLLGYTDLAADVGIVQGATLATFYVFSANARSLILTNGGEFTASRFLQMRLLLILPLSFIAFFLSTNYGNVANSLAITLILRRAVEWIGELGLSQHERLNQQNFVQRAIFGEVTGFFLCLVLSVGFGADLADSAIPWAFAPLLLLFRAQFSLNACRLFKIYSFLPHIGSTAIIGISVYLFRISVNSVAGKVYAGELFTAFAIGGIIPTIFSQALLPTLIRNLGSANMPSMGWLVTFLAAILAGGVVILAIDEPAWLLDLGRPPIFWLATGLSISGGAFMTVAAIFRAHLIQNDEQGVFGPDVMANVLIVSLIPFVYFTLGVESLAGLYFLSAFLNLLYMWGAAKWKSINGRFLSFFLFALGLLLVAPIFFQLKGGLFRDPAIFFDTEGKLLNLPIPLSVLALFVGIAFIGNYKTAKRSLAVVFFTMLLLLACLLRAGHLANDGVKFVLMWQFLLPIFGLVLGEIFGAVDRGHVFERAALSLLLVILPAQLTATWFTGHVDAMPLVFVFSIYQHLQYFPAIVAALATMTSLALWSRSVYMRIAIGLMFPIVMVHMVASASINGFASTAIGMVAFMLFNWRYARARRHLLASLAVALLAAALNFALVYSYHSGGNYYYIPEAAVTRWSVSATDAISRVEQWRFFANGIGESTQAFLFGHATGPDRNLHPNAQNYWLEVIYNFGIIAIFPLIVFIASTSLLVWKQRSRFQSVPLLLGTTMAAGYLVLVESMFNIGMRQPYMGILTFFILGLLNSRLRSVK
jgi:hypothetical protein